jgi:thiol:disulfide interchange protein
VLLINLLDKLCHTFLNTPKTFGCLKNILLAMLSFSMLFAPSCGSRKPVERPEARPPAQPQPAPKPPPEATDIAWLDSERLMPVLELATQENKLVFVEFFASWCAPCKVMEEEIFTQPGVFLFLNANFLNFRTDFDSPAGRTIAEIYEVEKLPTVLFLAPNGVVLERHTGMANPSVLRSLGNSSLEKWKK